MKYGIVISASKTKFGPIVFRENLKENISKAANLGYDGVELAIRDPETLRIDEVKELLDSHNIAALSIGTGQIYLEEGLSFSDSDKDIRNQAVNRTKKIIDIAGNFNAAVTIGLLRGNVKDMDNFSRELEKAEEKIAQCLEEILSYGKAESKGILLEPINRYETNIFNKIEDVYNFLIKFKDRLDPQYIGILADIFHMNIEEQIIAESLKKYSGLIRHVHFADSNRWPPGYGHTDFAQIMETLKACSYKGFISFEMLPLPDPDTAAKDALSFVKKFE